MFKILTLDGGGRGDERFDWRLFLGFELCRGRWLFSFGGRRRFRLDRVDFWPDRNVLVVGESDQPSVGSLGSGRQGLSGRQQDRDGQQVQTVHEHFARFVVVVVCSLRRARERLYILSTRSVSVLVRSVCSSIVCLAKRLRPDDLYRPIRFDVVQCHGRGCVFIFIYRVRRRRQRLRPPHLAVT